MDDDAPEKAAKESAERESQFRLEALEPRLLLSADPISTELARAVQDDAQSSNEADVAAIIQQIDTIVENNAADSSGDGHDDFTVSFPDDWNVADESENTELNLLSVMMHLVDEVSDAMEKGADTSELIVSVSADSMNNPEDTVTSEKDLADTEAEMNQALTEVTQSNSTSPLSNWISNLNIELVDLDGDTVAELNGNTLFIDINAAGNGWYIDSLLLEQLVQLIEGEAQGISPSSSHDGAQNASHSDTSTLIDEAANNHETETDDNLSILSDTDAQVYGYQSDDAHELDQNDDKAATHNENNSSSIAISGPVATGPPSDSVRESGNNESSSQQNDNLLQQLLELLDGSLALNSTYEGINGADLVMVQFAAALRMQLKNESDNDVSASTTKDYSNSPLSEGAEARAPPTASDMNNDSDDNDFDNTTVAVIVMSADATASNNQSDVSAHTHTKLDSDNLSSDSIPEAEMPRAPPLNDALSRAPPANDSIEYLIYDGLANTSDQANKLTEEQLQSIFQQAIQIWSNFSTSSEVTDKLNSIVINISELGDGILGATDSYSIYIDTNAAGLGWFIDATADDNTEFELIDGLLIATTDSEAFGRIDLLTVVLHEIGHVLGYDHNADLNVMAEKLGLGERATLDDLTNLPQENLSSVNANQITGTSPDLTLDLTLATNDTNNVVVTIHANSSVEISGSAIDDTAGTPIFDITNIVGNTNGTLEIVGPDADVVWTLDSTNSGSLTVAGIYTITLVM